MAEDKAISLNNGLPTIRNWTKEKYVEKVTGKDLSSNDFTNELLAKLNGIAAGANKYTHPAYTAQTGGFYKVTVDTLGHISAVEAVTKADITALGIPGQDTNTTYAVVTTTQDGLMDKSDKVKLDGIAAGANKYVHPAYTAKSSGLYKITVDATGHVSAVAALAKADITGLGIPGQDTTYTAATSSKDGLMSKENFAKLAAFQEASNYALKSDISEIYRYKGSVANEAALPTTGNAIGDVYNIEAKSSYGAAGMNVAWKKDGTWDNLGGNFSIDYATAAEVLAILNA